METKILKIDADRAGVCPMGEAAEVIKKRGLVAFPAGKDYGHGAATMDRLGKAAAGENHV